MAKRASEKNRATTQVALGWRVQKTWKDDKDKEHKKFVSRLMSSESSAHVFRTSAEKYGDVVDGEKDVVYQVVSEDGFDDIPVPQ